MKWIRYGLPLALLLLLCFFLKTGITQHRQEKIIYAPSLQKGQQEKILFNARSKEVTIITPSGKPGEARSTSRTSYAPGRVSIVEDDKGRISVKIQKSGLCFTPGISCGSASGRLRLGLDIQWYYIQRWGLVTGLSGEARGAISPRAYLGLSYQPPIRFFSNTSLLVGVDNKKDIVLGIRISL